MFLVERNNSNPFSIEKLKPAFANLQKPIRLIHEFLLGKSRPTCLNGKQMWVYWSYWWPRVHQEDQEGIECPSLKPDWARLVLEDLSSEIEAVRKHLKRDVLPKKRYASNCGTAITKFLLHHGYSMEELQQKVEDEDSGTEAQNAGAEEVHSNKKATQESGVASDSPERALEVEVKEQEKQSNIIESLVADLNAHDVKWYEEELEKSNNENKTLKKELSSLRATLLAYQSEGTDHPRGMEMEDKVQKTMREGIHKGVVGAVPATMNDKVELGAEELLVTVAARVRSAAAESRGKKSMDRDLGDLTNFAKESQPRKRRRLCRVREIHELSNFGAMEALGTTRENSNSRAIVSLVAIPTIRAPTDTSRPAQASNSHEVTPRPSWPYKVSEEIVEADLRDSGYDSDEINQAFNGLFSRRCTTFEDRSN